jgi:3-phosphoshikimate 1-carboxyvinyltransferase
VQKNGISAKRPDSQQALREQKTPPNGQLFLKHSLRHPPTTFHLLHLDTHPTGHIQGEVWLPGSKSISNRALIIAAICRKPILLEGLSAADDTEILQIALAQTDPDYNVGHAGTACRFMTAYLAIRPGVQTLTGSARMLERPIGPLVDALRQLGCTIRYTKKQGFPPLTIGYIPKSDEHQVLSLPAHISSQFISALLMIGPTFQAGLTIQLTGSVVSASYIRMTTAIMAHFGIHVNIKANQLIIPPGNYEATVLRIEPDWSAASYVYGIVALSKAAIVYLPGLKQDSLQGDVVIARLAESFGVMTEFDAGGARIIKHKNLKPLKNLTFDMIESPDLIQTICFIAAGLGINLYITGWQTLRVKETDRIAALQTELAKVDVQITIEGDTLMQKGKATDRGATTVFHTYQDHRMAMAASMLSMIMPVDIENPEVVHKSFPDFWQKVWGV